MTSDSRTARLKNWFEILMTSLVSKSTNLTNLLFSKFGPAVSFYLDQYLHFYIGYKLHLKLLMGFFSYAVKHVVVAFTRLRKVTIFILREIALGLVSNQKCPKKIFKIDKRSSQSCFFKLHFLVYLFQVKSYLLSEGCGSI